MNIFKFIGAHSYNHINHSYNRNCYSVFKPKKEAKCIKQQHTQAELLIRIIFFFLLCSLLQRFLPCSPTLFFSHALCRQLTFIVVIVYVILVLQSQLEYRSSFFVCVYALQSVRTVHTPIASKEEKKSNKNKSEKQRVSVEKYFEMKYFASHCSMNTVTQNVMAYHAFQVCNCM